MQSWRSILPESKRHLQAHICKHFVLVSCYSCPTNTTFIFNLQNNIKLIFLYVDNCSKTSRRPNKCWRMQHQMKLIQRLRLTRRSLSLNAIKRDWQPCNLLGKPYHRVYHIVMDHAFWVEFIVTYHQIQGEKCIPSEGFFYQSILHILSVTVQFQINSIQFNSIQFY